MKKIITKIIIVVCMMNMIVFNINTVQAYGLGNVFSGGDSFIYAGKKGSTKIDEEKLKSTSSDIYNILLVIGICVAVITISVLGIKFMIGSIEEKAQVKESLIPFVIGCIVVFGAFGIWKMVTELVSMVPTVF